MDYNPKLIVAHLMKVHGLVNADLEALPRLSRDEYKAFNLCNQAITRPDEIEEVEEIEMDADAEDPEYSNEDLRFNGLQGLETDADGAPAMRLGSN